MAAQPMRTFHIARTLDDWRTLTGQTVRFHTYTDLDREEPGDHRGVMHGVGTFGGVVSVVVGGRFVDVDQLTVVEVLDSRRTSDAQR